MKGRTCLVGYSGFVGSNLLEKTRFDDLFRSSNIHEIRGKSYELLVCAGVPAVKWHANKFPEQDRRNIDALLGHLATVRVDKFVLISTVDVYPVTVGVDESFDCSSLPNHAYGTNRLHFETKLASLFEKLYTLRLAGLFGSGLKKNVIFDLLHDNCLAAINPESVFQYYDLSCLWADIGTAMRENLQLVNLVTEPLATGTLIDRFFPGKQVGAESGKPGRYDILTCHAPAFGKVGAYRFSAGEVLTQLAHYIHKVRGTVGE